MKKITMQKKDFLKELNEHIINTNKELIESVENELILVNNANKSELEKLQLIFNRVLFNKIDINKIPCLLVEKWKTQYTIMLIDTNEYKEHKEKYNNFINDKNVNYDDFSTFICDNFCLMENASLGIKIGINGIEIDNVILFATNESLQKYNNIKVNEFYSLLFIITYLIDCNKIELMEDKIYTIVNDYAIYKENEFILKDIFNNKSLLDNCCLYYYYDDDDFNYKTVVIENEITNNLTVYSPDDFE